MQRRRWLQAGAAALGGLAAAWAAPAAARDRDDDDGQFVILHARYGTERRQVDVTGPLRDLARHDQRLRLTNELFGVDPDPGRPKWLRIVARDRHGRERHLDYREHDWLDGSRFSGWGRGGDRRDDGDYRILYATYGIGRQEVDVTDRLRELARRDRHLRLTNELFGVDPAPGRTKRLRIVARDRHGHERHFDYREYSHIDGNLFTGWRRGDWGPPRPRDAHAGGRWVDVADAVRPR